MALKDNTLSENVEKDNVVYDDKKYMNEHGRYTTFEKYQNSNDENLKDNQNIKITKITPEDINLSKISGYSKYDLDTVKTITNNPDLTQEEFNSLKKNDPLLKKKK